VAQAHDAAAAMPLLQEEDNEGVGSVTSRKAGWAWRADGPVSVETKRKQWRAA
jgi:hypothetical protein